MENALRIIGYCILCGVNGLLYYFLHSHFHFIVLFVMLFAPLFSIVLNALLKKKLSVSIYQGCAAKTPENTSGIRMSEYGRQNESAYFTVKINNPSIAASLDAKLEIEVGNSFFGTSGSRIFSVPILPFRGYELELPIVPELPGNVYVKVKSVRVKDLTGFTFFKKTVDCSEEMTVLPECINDIEYEKTDIDSGMLESEESKKRGNDFSDVQEIREYIPGDKLMSIHWKLSAKRDILMVKDRVSMSDRQLVVLIELTSDGTEQLKIILSSSYSLIKQLIEDKTTVRFLYWSASRYEYEETRIDYAEELDNTFAKMFYEMTYPGMDEAASHMSMVHPEMQSYLHITAENGNACIKIRENA